MRNIDIKRYKNLTFGILALLLFTLSMLAFVTYQSRNMTDVSLFLLFAIRHHMSIMFTMILVSVAFGFFWSQLSYQEIRKEKRSSKEILELVMKFLSHDERKIINFLVENKGKSNQSEISKLENMGRVKAHRTLQKLQERDLIIITPHGKIRRLELQKNILHVLMDEDNKEKEQ